jgi:hypothetical protein
MGGGQTPTIQLAFDPADGFPADATLTSRVEVAQIHRFTAVWASRSGGKCLFVMPCSEKFEEMAKVAR